MNKQENKKVSETSNTSKSKLDKTEIDINENTLEHNNEKLQSIGFPDIDLKKQMGCGG